MRAKYESLPLTVLKDIAKDRGVKGVSTMKKAEVVEALLASDPKPAAGKVQTEAPAQPTSAPVAASQPAQAQENRPAYGQQERAYSQEGRPQYNQQDRRYNQRGGGRPMNEQSNRYGRNDRYNNNSNYSNSSKIGRAHV